VIDVLSGTAMLRTARFRRLVVLVALVAATSTSPVGVTAATGQGLVDLRSAPSPAEEPAAALDAVSCELADAERCALLLEQLLELPFAWHRTGYQLRIRDERDAPSGRRPGTTISGRTLARRRQMQLFVNGGDRVADPVAAFRGVERSLAHELGHVMHQTCGDEVLEVWRQVRGHPDATPDRGHGHLGIGFDSVGEDFAEAAMEWLTDGAFRSRSALVVSSPVPAYARRPMSVSDAEQELFRVCT
jgi:hypothetical protein